MVDADGDPAGGDPAAPAASIVPSRSRLRLDELLTELLDRAREVMAAQGRLRGLLDAVVAVASDLSLPVVLRRIVEAACALADARYAAIGVLGPDRALTDFIAVGIDDETRRAIGALPTGRGILGLLIDEARPVRLANLGAHPRSFGFPPHHPDMRSFLGVPIVVRGEVFGNLYLTEKQGAEEFTEEDQDLVVALAAAAAVGIENARLYQETRHRQRWLAASTDVSSALFETVDPAVALRRVVTRACDAADADLAVVVTPTGPGAALLVEAAAGRGAEAILGLAVPPEASLAGESLQSGQPIVVVDVRREPRAYIGPGVPGLGPAVFVPLAAPGAVLGVLVLGRRQAATPFTGLDVDMIRAYAAHAALALQFVRVQAERERLAVFVDRDRIARDLHDLVIQRLFAIGLSLQGLERHVDGPVGRDRLAASIDDLDQTIRDIRRTIFSLQSGEAMDRTLRAQLIDVATAASRSLGFDPRLRFEGPIDSAVAPDAVPHVVATLREALSNAARHAQADSVEVTVRVDSDSLELRVSDDGRGFTAGQRESGLRNLRQRAESLGGEFRIDSTPGRGTRLVWRVPLAGP